jgi:hypothetical protein
MESLQGYSEEPGRRHTPRSPSRKPRCSAFSDTPRGKPTGWFQVGTSQRPRQGTRVRVGIPLHGLPAEAPARLARPAARPSPTLALNRTVLVPRRTWSRRRASRSLSPGAATVARVCQHLPGLALTWDGTAKIARSLRRTRRWWRLRCRRAPARKTSAVAEPSGHTVCDARHPGSPTWVRSLSPWVGKPADRRNSTLGSRCSTAGDCDGTTARPAAGGDRRAAILTTPEHTSRLDTGEPRKRPVLSGQKLLVGSRGGRILWNHHPCSTASSAWPPAPARTPPSQRPSVIPAGQGPLPGAAFP